jgi:hypothetical protein
MAVPRRRARGSGGVPGVTARPLQHRIWQDGELVVVGVVMAPSPVILLLAVIDMVELVILVVSFGQIDAVGTILAVVPLVVILVVAIIVTSVIAFPDDDFLRGGFSSQRDDKCSGGEKQSETLNESLHEFSVDRELQGRVVACAEYADWRRRRLCVCGHARDS